MPLALIHITLKEVKCQQYKAIVLPFVKSFVLFQMQITSLICPPFWVGTRQVRSLRKTADLTC